MSVEDSDSDFQSRESDYEEKLDDGETDEEELSYVVQMLLLYHNLLSFQRIYNNNALIDMEYSLRQAASIRSLISSLSELDLSDDSQDAEDVLSTISSVTSNEAELSSDNAFFLICFGDLIELSEDEVSTSSSSSSSSSWFTVSDDEEGESDTDYRWSDAQDEDAEDQL